MLRGNIINIARTCVCWYNKENGRHWTIWKGMKYMLDFFETEQLVLYKTDGTTTIIEGLVEPDMIYTDDGSANI